MNNNSMMTVVLCTNHQHPKLYNGMASGVDRKPYMIYRM